MHLMQAGFSNTCHRCYTPIEEGDWIERSSLIGLFCHATCVDLSDISTGAPEATVAAQGEDPPVPFVEDRPPGGSLPSDPHNESSRLMEIAALYPLREALDPVSLLKLRWVSV